jgi:hypothetical protein
MWQPGIEVAVTTSEIPADAFRPLKMWMRCQKMIRKSEKWLCGAIINCREKLPAVVFRFLGYFCILKVVFF